MQQKQMESDRAISHNFLWVSPPSAQVSDEFMDGLPGAT